jgi:hypothetical protein
LSEAGDPRSHHASDASEPIDIRVPIGFRLPLFVLAAILVGTAAVGAWYLITEAPQGDTLPGFLVVAGLLAFGLWFWRMATARLTLVADTFEVRNIFSAHRISVSDVDHFEIGDHAWGISPDASKLVSNDHRTCDPEEQLGRMDES